MNHRWVKLILGWCRDKKGLSVWFFSPFFKGKTWSWSLHYLKFISLAEMKKKMKRLSARVKSSNKCIQEASLRLFLPFYVSVRCLSKWHKKWPFCAAAVYKNFFRTNNWAMRANRFRTDCPSLLWRTLGNQWNMSATLMVTNSRELIERNRGDKRKLPQRRRLIICGRVTGFPMWTKGSEKHKDETDHCTQVTYLKSISLKMQGSAEQFE